MQGDEEEEEEEEEEGEGWKFPPRETMIRQRGKSKDQLPQIENEAADLKLNLNG